MKEIELRGLKIPYDVRESEEASNPRIDHNMGEFTVVIPSEQNLDPQDMIRRKERWVSDKRKEFLRFRRKIPERNLQHGGELKVLGEEKDIVVEKRRKNSLDENVRLAEHLVERTSVKDQLEKLLKDEAREMIESKVSKYEAEVDGEYEKIFIRDQKTRWGSCTDKGNLNFNWRLILGPEHVLEYVVVHELVHLEEQNHTERFWSRVRDIYPRYKESNKWLEDNSSKLVFSEEMLN